MPSGKRRRNLYRWYWDNMALVQVYFTSKGERRLYARIHIPSGAYSSRVAEQTVATVEEGEQWLRKQADEWAEKNGVEWLS